MIQLSVHLWILGIIHLVRTQNLEVTILRNILRTHYMDDPLTLKLYYIKTIPYLFYEAPALNWMPYKYRAQSRAKA